LPINVQPGQLVLSRPWRTVLVLMLLLVVGFAAGPRVEVDHVGIEVQIPDDVDRYIVESETRVAGLVPGTEKLIVRHPDAGQNKTALSIVYFHGFTASRQELSPVPQELASRLGANLFLTRLAGHGIPGDALGAVTVEDWMRDAVEAMQVGRSLGERVLVIGTSTGATLATWLAASDYAEDLQGVVLMSPNFGPSDPRADILTWPWGRQIAELVQGEYRSWKPVNERHARYWTTRYPTRALVTMMSLVDLVRQQDLARVRAPVLVMYSPQDRLIDTGRIIATANSLDPDLVTLVPVEDPDKPHLHVLAGDILSPSTSPLVLETIAGFARRTTVQ
jgi:esterase/lipase